MKKALRLLFFCGIAFVVLAASFYLWAVQTNLAKQAHNSISTDSSMLSIDTVAKKPITFSIMTYNIGYLSGLTNNRAVDRTQALFDQNLDSALSLFGKYSPDIVAFQEIDYGSARSYHVDQEEHIASALQYPYRARAVNWDKRYVAFPYWPPSAHFGKIISGQSVISRYPVAAQRVDTLDRVMRAPFFYRDFYLERLAQVCTLRIAQQDLIVINLHLEAFDRDTRQKQMQRIKALYKQYAASYPTIMLGDFNSSPNEVDPTIKSLFNDDLRMGAVDLEWGKLTYTYSSESPHSRLDYIFFSDQLRLVSGGVVAAAGTISDHLPVRATFQLVDRE
ncbi:endonuclease/exonuclease/phosphatase family protein [Sphingobacterium oryzagri]|uniref:Endonuclease/exonuclease/phosphatase family protein n=1 Tax=Sphingobacterium oryzagri TaxID=3025669 RepID=A0ABY7WH99_9SPHI|nr:endonuclease/exonuclease/phosphatase family protein [Sphingobacterium sp. KACC 22765]WDF69006.1 endonuclease/exonuclease/phosphatase family protein [Sphingobacterium sp. KACC 22765]